MKQGRRIVLSVALLFVGLAADELRGDDPPPCEIVDKKDVAKDATSEATGQITANQTSWQASFSGGQAAWIELKNGNVHLTPIIVTFTDKVVLPKPETRIACRSQVIIPPQSTRVVKWAVFGEKISYNVEVALPNEPPIDSALIHVNAKVQPVPPSPTPAPSPP